ncbi:hypothetical protein RchiOBHm_Chr1g0326671 [Rosa chinensis]|uniref:Uncharacterized protein n=1 Tax=Rosa chinensis TaxID=74649 RepID=A0A2P6SAC2_ROSCH|nr:hypothetical protein RchiOBHm_Chr1g0326671 [Rosa chinensis]
MPTRCLIKCPRETFYEDDVLCRLGGQNYQSSGQTSLGVRAQNFRDSKKSYCEKEELELVELIRAKHSWPCKYQDFLSMVLLFCFQYYRASDSLFHKDL